MAHQFLSWLKRFFRGCEIAFYLPLLPAFIPSLSPAGENEAYLHLDEVMDQCHAAFHVYANQDDGCNHFSPPGWMGDRDSVSFDSSWTTGCRSGDSCIRIAFSANGSNWAGFYWLEPADNRASVPNGGYDLSGAAKLTFWAKGEKGGEKIEFFAGGVTGTHPDSFPRTSTGLITLTPSWQPYTIDLSSRNLRHVIGGFAWVTNSAFNPTGATFYLDDIAYDKARRDEVRFLKSYEALSVVEPDRGLKNTGFTYDNALALLSYLARGAADDLRRAKLLADAFVQAIDRDRYYTDGRVRNAYMAGDLIDHRTGKARIPGWWDPAGGAWREDAGQVGSDTGNVAWAMIALLHFYKKNGGQAYLDKAVGLGEWLERETRDARCQGGYTGGYEGWEPNPDKLFFKSTEHNLDAYVAFRLLHDISRDAKWRQRALHARHFVESMWDADGGHFWTGTLNDGCTPNKADIPLDIQAWAVMVLGGHPAALRWAENNARVVADGFRGFDFNTDRDGVWFEGTGQMAVAYQLNRQNDQSDAYTGELGKAQQSALNANGKGIVAASRDGLTTGFDWRYFRRLHVAATAWYLFAERNHNPYWGTSTLSPVSLKNWSPVAMVPLLLD